MTRPRLGITVVAGCLMAAGLVRADLAQVKAEPNLEKRSRLALDNASSAFAQAREAYEKGDLDQVRASAAEVQQSVELANDSLNQTGKDPRKNSRWFKNAELRTRDLLRKLDGLAQQMSIADRPILDPVVSKLQQIHDDLLEGLMEGKRK